MTDFPFAHTDLFDAIAIPATLIDAEGIILDVNSAFMTFVHGLGIELEKEDRIGRPLSIFAHNPEEREQVEAIVREVLTGGEGHYYEIGWIGSTERSIYVDIHAEAMRDAAGRIKGAVILREDVTERVRLRQRQQALVRVRDEIWRMRGEEDIGKLLKAIRDGLRDLEIPFEGLGINVVEPAPEDCFGVRYFESIGAEGRWRHSNMELGDEQIIDMWRRGVPVYRPNLEAEDLYREQHDLKQGFFAPICSVIDIPFADGTLAINSARADAFSEADIAFMQELAAALSDGFRRLDDLGQLGIRAREAEALAATLEQRTRELERQIDEREVLEEQLRQAQKMEAVGQLTAGIAHNFNNLLQGIIGNIDLCLEEGAESLRPMLEDMGNAGFRAAELVQQLMVFSRQGVQTQYASVDTRELIGEVVGICHKTFDRRIRINLDETSMEAQVMGNRGQLEQVFLNLLINARDALLPHERRPPIIRVNSDVIAVQGNGREAKAGTMQRPGSYVRFCVEDNGEGMDAETRARIFEPFFTTKEVDVGTGLGLSTAYGIVRQHGGWIECDSKPSAGSIFSIFLPLWTEIVDGEGETEEVGELKGDETILVIEDEEMVRKTTILILRQYGYAALAAADGIEGLDVLRREEGGVDLVLLDLSMPRLSGAEVLVEIRALRPQLKVVLCTGYTSRERDFEGISGVVQKPFKGEDLARAVRGALDG
jgi:PAS domain S-box-containing protein